ELEAVRRDIADVKLTVLARPAASTSPSPSSPTLASPPSEAQPHAQRKETRDEAAARRNSEPRVVISAEGLPDTQPLRALDPDKLLRTIAPRLKEKTGIHALRVVRLHSKDVMVALPTKEDEYTILDWESDDWLPPELGEGGAQPKLR
ncbi:hypothetical protein V8E36_007011, partial [Tilletia maclaganii]